MKKVFIIVRISGHTVVYMYREGRVHWWRSKLHESTFFYTKNLAERIVYDLNESNQSAFEIKELYVRKILAVANQKRTV